MTSPRTFDIGDLAIGVATAATQIEGGDLASSWHDFARQRGRIADGSTPVRATEHWERWQEDTALMAQLGLQVYRMSVDWARVEPSPGVIDREALQHYRRELEAVRSAGIEPLVSLHHFTNPTWLEAKGAWLQPAAVDRWLSFVEVVVRELGDVVTDWATINEPNVYATQGYLFEEFPPGRSNDFLSVRKVLRHMAIAHCRAYRLIHTIAPASQVGLAHHLRAFTPFAPGNPAHRLAARFDAHLFQDVLTDAALGGRFARVIGGQPPGIAPGRYYDYVGINYYTRSAVSGIGDGRRPDVAVNDLDWEIYPRGIVEVVAPILERYPGPVWVSENGADDRQDRFRSRFIHDHLAAMVGSGLPFERYYHWCFVDNWEWAEGWGPRFGIVGLDPATQKRRVKESGHFVREIIANRGVTEEMYTRYVEPQRYRIA